MGKKQKPVIKSETGVSPAFPDAAASPAALTADHVSVLQKVCIPTAKRIKLETDAGSPAPLGIAASPSPISSVFTGRQKLKPVIKYETVEESSVHCEAVACPPAHASAPSDMTKRSDQAEAAATSDKQPDGDLSADRVDAPPDDNAPAAGSDSSLRCKSWKTGGPSVAAILLRFCNEHPRYNDYVRLFTQMLQSYGWDSCSCKYQEEVPYADMHGASIIAKNTASFLSWYMVRKVMSSAAEKKKAATAMSILLQHCTDNKYLTKLEVQPYVKMVQEIKSFDADGLGRSIQSLYNAGYWNKERRRRREKLEQLDAQFEELLAQCGYDEANSQFLEERLQELHATLLSRVSQPAPVAAAPAPQPAKKESEVSSAAAAGPSLNPSACVEGVANVEDSKEEEEEEEEEDDDNDDDDDYDDDFDDDDDDYDDYDECVEDEGGMVIREVRSDGGKRGVRFSCMALVLRLGIWSPKGMYGNDDMVFANVYPPN